MINKANDCEATSSQSFRKTRHSFLAILLFFGAYRPKKHNRGSRLDATQLFLLFYSHLSDMVSGGRGLVNRPKSLPCDNGDCLIPNSSLCGHRRGFRDTQLGASADSGFLDTSRGIRDDFISNRLTCTGNGEGSAYR